MHHGVNRRSDIDACEVLDVHGTRTNYEPIGTAHVRIALIRADIAHVLRKQATGVRTGLPHECRGPRHRGCQDSKYRAERHARVARLKEADSHVSAPAVRGVLKLTHTRNRRRAPPSGYGYLPRINAQIDPGDPVRPHRGGHQASKRSDVIYAHLPGVATSPNTGPGDAGHGQHCRGGECGYPDSMAHRLSVIGTGYLGATHAACMAGLGFEVIGVDVDPTKVEMLSSGRVPFFEPDLEEVLERNIASGRLTFTTSFADAGEFADVHFICVGTPQQAGANTADMTQVFGAVDALASHLGPDDLVVGKSTVPVGTADAIAARITTEVAWNPEFLREGFAVSDTLSPDRLVIGVRSERAETILREVYAPITATGVPLLVTDFPTAELVKVAANSFLATKISFINAMAEVCEAAGADVVKLAEAIGYDPRIGNRFLAAGLGFGVAACPRTSGPLWLARVNSAPRRH